MRKHVLAGIGSAMATVAGMFSLSFALAVGTMNPMVVREANQDLTVKWGKHSSSLVTTYRITQCPYVSAPELKCVAVTDVTANPAFDEFQITIAASNVLTQTNAVVKIIAENRAVTPTDEIARENVRINAVAQPTPTPPSGGSTETIELVDGCQQNIAVGNFPADTMQRVVDAGGIATIQDAGAVYQLTLKDRGVHEDDAGLTDLRDFEHECRTLVAMVVQQ